MMDADVLKPLQKLAEGRSRLFTYKVAADKGSAPNPFEGLCTLAICKPRIRAVAAPDDVIVGFGTRTGPDPDAEERRIVYVMVVKESLPWIDYENESQSRGWKRIPVGGLDYGDCIWRSDGIQSYNSEAENLPEPKLSWSGHDSGDFTTDVIAGKKVLVGDHYWYFGSGSRFGIRVDDALAKIVPRGIGHRSNANNDYRTGFAEFFSRKVREELHGQVGLLGEPKLRASQENEKACRSCRPREKESDCAEEEV